MTPAELRQVAANLTALRDDHRKKADEHLAWADVLEDSIRYLNERAEKETSPAPADPDEETPCPKREDGIHCECWYGGNPCCGCGASDILDGREKAPCSTAKTRIEEAKAVCSACGLSGSGGLASGDSTVTIRCNKPYCPGGTSANREGSL